MTHFKIHATNRQHHRLAIPQLLAIAYPSGWSENQRNLDRAISSRTAMVKPPPTNPIARRSWALG